MTDTESVNPATYTPPSAPTHFYAVGRRFWMDFCRDWQLRDRDDLELLRLACEAFDRAEQARKALKKEGSLTYLDRFAAPHERPEIRIERQARAAAVSIVKQLQQARIAAERRERAEEERARRELSRRRGGGTRRHG